MGTFISPVHGGRLQLTPSDTSIEQTEVPLRYSTCSDAYVSASRTAECVTEEVRLPTAAAASGTTVASGTDDT